MSASLHPTEVHRRQHRKAKRDKLIAQIAAAPAAARAALAVKLEKTYPFGSVQKPPKASVQDAATPVPVAKS